MKICKLILHSNKFTGKTVSVFNRIFSHLEIEINCSIPFTTNHLQWDCYYIKVKYKICLFLFVTLLKNLYCLLLWFVTNKTNFLSCKPFNVTTFYGISPLKWLEETFQLFQIMHWHLKSIGFLDTLILSSVIKWLSLLLSINGAILNTCYSFVWIQLCIFLVVGLSMVCTVL